MTTSDLNIVASNETSACVLAHGVESGLREEVKNAPAARSSRISGFAQMSVKARLTALVERGFLSRDAAGALFSAENLSQDLADTFIENCIGAFALPLGVATNFLIDGREYLIPMAVEESSVVAAASHGAKLARSRGGFFTSPTKSIATSQIQFTVQSEDAARVPGWFESVRAELIDRANACHPRLLSRGGGTVGVEIRILPKPGVFVIHVHVDTREAMGANIVNTIAEDIGRWLPSSIPCRVGLKILTNLTVHRITRVRCEVDSKTLEIGGFTGAEAVDRIVEAWEFAELDPYRAATHNKGIMNGIDPVVIATGNDWRAVEAGAHAFAAMSGQYKPLTRWIKGEEGQLVGEIAVPVAVGTVGGVTRLHPAVQSTLSLLGHPEAGVLSGLIASVGLAQNLSALRALACEGIQRGHMALHEKNIEMLRRYDHMPSLTAVARGTDSAKEP
ncbi:MAG: hydroxymethylglutaryl-CoA reductase, degradative [Betaproteobacteria bacterium]|nr:hydroxymethylglutaryl-CoA reductase, degradative [Betaproteobacteria bacterium]